MIESTSTRERFISKEIYSNLEFIPILSENYDYIFRLSHWKKILDKGLSYINTVNKSLEKNLSVKKFLELNFISSRYFDNSFI